jgi:hypothetical protein
VASGNDCVPLYNGRVDSCTDSDNGKNEWVKGTVTAPQGPWARQAFGTTGNPNAVSAYVDHCDQPTDKGLGRVVEYWCAPDGQGGYIAKADILTCPESPCQDGHCTSGQDRAPTPTPAIPAPTECAKHGCLGSARCLPKNQLPGEPYACTQEWLPWYACVQQAECGLTAAGSCDFAPRAAFDACLAQNGAPSGAYPTPAVPCAVSGTCAA